LQNATVAGFSYYLWGGLIVGPAAGMAWEPVIIFSIVSLALLGFGAGLVRLYFSWKGRYKSLLEMEKKWSKVDG
jgi:hypothetical protein